MNLWRWLSRSLPAGYRRGDAARHSLATSYQRLFAGHGGEADAQIVLADLANYTGFYRVSGLGFSAEDRAFADGMRAGYGRIFQFLRMTDHERSSLEQAARAEALVDNSEGTL